MLICLHLHLIDHIGKQTFVGKKIFFAVSFTSLNVFLIIHFKHVLTVVDKKVMKCVSYTKCLVVSLQNFVPNAQNKALKKQKLDSNRRNGVIHYVS